MALDKIAVGFSPLTGNINLYRMGKDPTVALESRDATNQVFGTVVECMMHGTPTGAERTVTAGDQAWTVTVRPAAQPSEDDVQDLAMALAWEHACATRQADRDKEIPLEHWMQLDAWERVGFTAAANAAIKILRPAGVLVDVAAERRRQIEVEGWAPEHDDAHHAQGEMAVAAACYILNGAGSPHPAPPNARPTWWPWSIRWWKPKSRRRDLIRAIALLVAEVERQDRANPAQESSHG